MIEKTILNYLNEHLEVGVYMEVPENLPETFVLVEKVDSGRTNFISSATFALRSFSGSLLNAAELNEAVKEVMDGITELDEISACRFDRDYNFTDTSTKKYRYQSLYVITHY